MISLHVQAEQWPIDGEFTISRGSKTTADIVVCAISAELNGRTVRGRGECVPYARYGETIDSVIEEINSVAIDIKSGLDRQGLLANLPAGAARNAVDCALWDFDAKRDSTSVAAQLIIPSPNPLLTAYTLSLDTPQTMGRLAAANAERRLLKIKVGRDDDLACIEAVATGAPNSRIIVDANEAWSPDDLPEMLAACAELNVALVEQPLPAEDDAVLAEIAHPVPICADESMHAASDVPALAALYDMVNIKLDKTGGLTEALNAKQMAMEHGLGVMIGCMVGTSLAMAPAVLLAQDADFIDLDGPLLLAKDRDDGLHYFDDLVSPPTPALWG
ncbi:MAG: N-acetyl-D-Glu racemase DgcA [Pseudomonadota bacterium]